ncbi:MAG: SMP-30/gluconolactonase/LRE family protein [Chloroflexota bacterium]
MIRRERAEHLLSVQNRLGEGPRWNAAEGRLYWVDIESNLFYRYDPATGQQERFDTGMPVGVLAFREAGGLIMATRDGFATWDTRSGTMTHIADVELDKVASRFNDGGVDPAGRFWAGTLTHDNTASSSLYRLDPDGSVHTMETGVGISNGIGWSPNGKTMYYTDTPRRVIYAYDFDVLAGAISNRRIFVQVAREVGAPDGLTVDAEGYVWSAHWGGSRVTRYDPHGQVERVVELPVSQITSCVFGGPNLTDLYITSAWSEMSDEQRAREPMAGDLFVLHTDIKGQEEPQFKG